MRPRQWVKNGFVFAPLLFSKSFFSWESNREALLAFVLFCMASSLGYVVNDLCDIEKDRQHPVKRLKRPLAAGDVTPPQAVVLVLILALGVVGGCILLPRLALPTGAYLALTFSYSVRLKHIAVIDLFAIAAGFVLRVYAGAVAIAVTLSFWMFITTLCLAIYLATMKRRQELIACGAAARGVLKDYTVPMLNYFSTIAAVTTLVFYGLYVATIKQDLIFSVVLVLLGLFRYHYLAEMKGEGESPTDVVWKDPVLGITVLLWVGFAVWVLR